MRLRFPLLSLILLLSILNASYGFLPVVAAAFGVVRTVGKLFTIGSTINKAITLKRINSNSKLAVEMLQSLGKAFDNHGKEFDHRIKSLHSAINSQLELTKNLIESVEKHERVFDHRINTLHSAVTLQFFQETVGFPAHNLFMTANKYFKKQTKTMEKLLINECLKSAPYTRLNDLNTLISEKWFLSQAKSANYRLPDVEAIRLRILNAMDELYYSHIICMSIQDDPLEETELTDIVYTTLANVINTLDKELKIIEASFFPEYVIKEVKKLVAETTFPEEDLKRRVAMAETTLNMLRKNYGPGIVVNSKNQSLFVQDYEVQVDICESGGKIPKDAVIDLKINKNWFLITRADRFGVDPGFDPDTYVKRLSYQGWEDWGIKLRPELFTEDVLAVTWMDPDTPLVRCPRKSVYPILTYKRKNRRIALTGAYLDPPSDHTPSELKNEEELAAIQDLRIAVQAELIALENAKNSGSSIAVQRLVFSIFLVICWTVVFSNNF